MGRKFDITCRFHRSISKEGRKKENDKEGGEQHKKPDQFQLVSV